MLGYVYDIDLAEAQKKSASKIDKCKKDLKLVQSMQESTLLVQPSIQETHHLLENCLLYTSAVTLARDDRRAGAVAATHCLSACRPA